MRHGFKAVGTARDRAWVRIAVVAAALQYSPTELALAQTPSLVVASPTSVQQGQPLRVTGLPCATARFVLLDGTAIPSKAVQGEENTFEVATGSLVPKTYAVAMKCGDATSQATTIEIVPPRILAKPTVICAENRSPRDDDVHSFAR